MSAGTVYERLGSVAEITSGQPAPQGKEFFVNTGNPFVRAGSLANLIGGNSDYSPECISDEMAGKFRLRLFPADTVVFAKSGMSAKIGRVYRLKTPSYLVSHLAAILPSQSLDPSYLQYWLEKNPPSQLIPNDSYPSIRISAIANMKMAVLPIQEQRRIASILDKADEIRKKRNESIELLDEFLKSVFYDMFGDPVTNPNGYETKTIDEAPLQIVDGDRGKAYPKSTDFIDEGHCLFLSTRNVTRKGFVFENCMFINEIKDKELGKGKLLKNDVVMTTRGTVGNVAYYSASVPFDNIRINSGMLIFRVDTTQLHPEYLEYFLRCDFFKSQITRSRSGSAQPQLPISSLKSLAIVLPSLRKQLDFVKLYHNTKELVKGFEAASLESSNLFNSLMQRAFKGEL